MQVMKIDHLMKTIVNLRALVSLLFIFQLVLSVDGQSLENRLAQDSKASAVAEDGWTPLFNNQNLDGWYTWLPSTGKNNDPKGVFKVENGMLHFLDIPVTDQDEDFGYLATNNEYSNYRLRFEYKWGQKKFPPRAFDKRDSGLLYHVGGADQIWPHSFECQVQEGDTGDYFLLGGDLRLSTLVANLSASINEHVYKEDGFPYTTQNSEFVITKGGTFDSLTDWNTVEVIVSRDAAVHIVNGQINNRATRLQQSDPNNPAQKVPLTKGRIVFQAEGAEIFYRNIEIKPLPTNQDLTYKVLVFSKTTGFRHDSISAGIAAIQELGAQNNFTVDATEDAAAFNDANLSQYRTVIFLSTTGDVLNTSQQAAFEHYIRAGNGYVGIHSASDTEYTWSWYGGLVGAYFSSHPEIQTATVRIENTAHRSTASLPNPWVRTDEWYNFQSNPRGNVQVLANLDETSYTGGTMGDHPIAWYHSYDGGRAWYTGGGHTIESYSEPAFRQHILGGIQYAADAASVTTLDRSNWSATASSSADGDPPSNAIDNNYASRWSTGAPQTPGQFFVIDMAAPQTFNSVVIDSGNLSYENDFPRSYAVYVSNDGTTWGNPVATGNGTSNLTTSTFAPQTARYIKIEQTGMEAYYWWSIHDLTVHHTLGIPKTNWNVTASSSADGEPPTNAVDGNNATRWSTGTAQTPGQFFQIDLGATHTFSQIVLNSGNSSFEDDYPRGYKVFVSNNGSTWGNPIATGIGNGFITEILFNQQQARYLRVEQTGSDSYRWWSIRELNIH
ncbi:CBM32 / CBM47 [uncultured Microcoleus sp.]|uniref:CBM32 / CBM47 n=1 Tax=uncultured Microcoleus sp. TaxID=259945 RepID=A0A6J4LTA4_9CYAN|nr:CBM32 / CBM47 [uncultured Microcoleus sp.]